MEDNYYKDYDQNGSYQGDSYRYGEGYSSFSQTGYSQPQPARYMEPFREPDINRQSFFYCFFMILMMFIPVLGFVICFLVFLGTISKPAKRNLAAACMVFNLIGMILIGALVHRAFVFMGQVEKAVSNYLGEYANLTELANDLSEGRFAQVIEKADTKKIIEDANVEELIEKIDLPAIIGELSEQGIIKERDVKKIIDKVDTKKLLEEMDVNELLENADLSEVDLSRLDFSEVDLSTINVEEADLSNIDYSKVDWDKFTDEELRALYEAMPAQRIAELNK